MKVILKESYMNLGEAGDIVSVKPGYARNFLLPTKLAVSATPANLKLFQDKQKEIEAKKTAVREESEKLMNALNGIDVKIVKKVGDDGKLFGSVSSKEIEEALAAASHKVDRRMIVMGQQIKMVGDYPIMIKLVGGMKAQVTLKIEAEASKKNV
ncbi:MAG: 50S ribosomal protein L9 [Bdellovibrionota bacterium]